MSNQLSDLFKNVKGTNKKDSFMEAYNFIEKRLKDSSLMPTTDVTCISRWLKIKYEKVYNRPMIGYNFYNCRITLQTLSRSLNVDNWALCQLVNKWFKTFHSLGYDKVGNDNTLTLSILKTSWIVEGLRNNRGPKSNSRNASYKNHGQGRREAGPNKNEICNTSF